jgi:hypothetical protein
MLDALFALDLTDSELARLDIEESQEATRRALKRPGEGDKTGTTAGGCSGYEHPLS